METGLALVKLMEYGLGIHLLVNVSGWSNCASASERSRSLLSVSAVVDCGSLVDPNNGQVNFSNTTFESTANYTCDLGYSLNGNWTRTCEANGEWSEDQPSCERKWLKYLYMHEWVAQFIPMCLCSGWLWQPRRSRQWSSEFLQYHIWVNSQLHLWSRIQSQWKQHSHLWSQWKMVWRSTFLWT